MAEGRDAVLIVCCGRMVTALATGLAVLATGGALQALAFETVRAAAQRSRELAA